jgi:hypothetical protein
MKTEAVIHQGAYYLKAIVSDGDRPRITFRSEGYPDAEITITEAGQLTFRRAVVETAIAAAPVALQHVDN